MWRAEFLSEVGGRVEDSGEAGADVELMLSASRCLLLTSFMEGKFCLVLGSQTGLQQLA